MKAQVDVVRSQAAFEDLRAEWQELLGSSAADSPFLTWEWLSAWWRHLGGQRTLHVLTVRSGPTLIGIVPLCRTSSGIGLTRLEFLGTGTVASDYLDLIVRAGRENDVRLALRAYLGEHTATLQLDHVQPGSMAERMANQLAEDGWVARHESIGVCPYIRTAGHTWESLLGTLGPSHRANVRRRIRALETGYDMTFELVTTEDRRRSIFPALVSLHNQRWGVRGGTAFHNQDSTGFHDLATRLLLEQGWLRLYALTLNGGVVAVQYLLGYRGRFYFYQHGYDARYSSKSVGLVSFALAIRSAIDEGASEFDMLWGDESYKRLWAHDARALLRIDLFPPGANGTLQRRAMEANHALRSMAKRLLNRPPEDTRG